MRHGSVKPMTYSALSKAGPPPLRSARSRSARSVAACFLSLASLLGCSESEDAPGKNVDAGGPLYAIMYEVYDDVGSTSYLSLLDSLDIEEVDPKQTREYGGGRAFVQTYNDWLFVGEAQTPTVIRYSVTEEGELEEESRVNFSNFGLQEGAFDSWNVTFISPEKAYLMDFREGRTIIWNPSTMEITGDIAPPEELLREGLSLEGSPGVLRDGLLFRTFDWVNYDDANYAPTYLLAVYDVEKDELVSLEEEKRCPVPGNLVHQDEAGNIYFSNWIWPVAGSLMRGAPQPCALRIKPGEQSFDAEWTLSYPDVTEGRQGAMFTYLGENRALISAFYDERTSFDETTDPWGYVGSNNWRVWSLDLETLSGKPVEGIDYNGGAFTPALFDGRQFIMVPGGDEVGYATQLYELEGDRAKPSVKLPGWSYQVAKLR